MSNSFPPLRPTAILFAHRGARAYAQENTLDAFSLALRLGASGLETDAWLTSDGVVVLDHDGVVAHRFRKRAISESRRCDLPPHIPSLHDLFDVCGVGYELSIDIKDADAFQPTYDAAVAAGFDLSRLWLCHPDYRVLIEQRRRLEGVRLVDSTRLARIKEGPERRMATLRENGIDCINMHHSDWNGGLTTLAHKFGRHAFGWDMQHESTLAEGLRIGLDGVYSDYTDRLVDAAANAAANAAVNAE